MRRHVARQIALGTHPGDGFADDADRAVANRAVGRVSRHRREVRPRDQQIEGRVHDDRRARCAR
jgi:hypothetical protein